MRWLWVSSESNRKEVDPDDELVQSTRRMAERGELNILLDTSGLLLYEEYGKVCGYIREDLLEVNDLDTIELENDPR